MQQPFLLGPSYYSQGLPHGMERGGGSIPSSSCRAMLLLSLNQDCHRRSQRDPNLQPSEPPNKATLRESDAAMAVIFIRICSQHDYSRKDESRIPLTSHLDTMASCLQKQATRVQGRALKEDLYCHSA